MLTLRDYQVEAINKARESFKAGNKKVALVLATGAGKSVIVKEIIKSAKVKVLYLTYRTVLIEQMKEYFKGLDVEFGTLQKYGKHESQTYNLVIIDEIHWAFSSKLQNNIKYKYLLGLTATPIDAQGYALDFDDLIDVVQLKDLIDLGYASPVKVMTLSKVNTDKLKTVRGDFDVKEAFALMDKSQIKKDIVNVYLKYAKNLKTIIYAVNIQHAENLKKEFLDKNILCETVHSKKKNTLEIIDNFRNNKINLLINADMLTTGVDIPDIYCLILASPTKSLIKSTQIYGRSTRLNPKDKNKTALIIDCANVIENTQHPLQKFDFGKIKNEKFKKCSNCQNKLNIINRQIQIIDQFSYLIKKTYKCIACEKIEEFEDIKTINYSFCESCNMQLENKITLSENKNDISFDVVCEHCGHRHTKRQYLLTDSELKEVELHDAEHNRNDWNAIEIILKSEAKKCGYNWRWVSRAMDILQDKDKSPKEIITQIKLLKSKGKKIGAIVYV